MKRPAIPVLVLLAAVLAGPRPGAAQSAPAGRVEIRDTERRFLVSKNVDQTYEIDVWFPPDYQKESARYPVLYVLDAEYNFGCASYIVKRLIKNGDIPKVLVVGIAYNTDEDGYYAKRDRDSTPPTTLYRQGGGVEPFVRFLETELIPFVDRTYRTKPEDRTIAGHSITGFFCAYAIFKHPRLFTRYLIVSPSLWYANELIFDYEKEFAGANAALNADVFLSTGRDESERMVRTAERMIRTLTGRKYAGLRFKSEIPEGEHHRSIFPAAFTRGMRWLFGAPR
jgi:predicted alpha/beta superfamily hydrolase